MWEEEGAGVDEADNELENEFDTDSKQEDYLTRQTRTTTTALFGTTSVLFRTTESIKVNDQQLVSFFHVV